MSYILDALKKNKSKDEQGEVPDLSSEHAYHEFEEEKSITRWVWPVVVMLLVLIIGVLGFMLLNPSAKEVSEQWTQKNPNSSQLQERSSESSVVATGKPLTPNKATSDANEDSRAEGDTQIVNKPLEVSEPVVQKVKRRVTSNTRDPNQSPSNVTKQESEPAVTKADLPALVYTTHIYATQPKDRFVMINGRALAEGDTISDKLKVKEILENDLVVTYQGQEFVLPSLEDVNVD